ncbi:MAG: alpha/beta hydrolase [Devosia sp.]|nr:alpha/beta hydrolase [Devosia sp.]
MTQRFTTSDGFSLAWYDLLPGTGVPIVLQHGFTASTRDEWVDCGIVERLAALGRPIIALDALGHGQSDKPHDEAVYGEARMARDISELVTHLQFERFDLVGYSMGAVISLLVGTAEPRLHRLVLGGIGEGAVVCGGVDTRVIDNRDLVAVMRAEDTTGFSAFVRGFREGAVARGNDLLALAAQAVRVHATPIPFETVVAPTLIIAGDADPLAVRPERLAAAIAGARCVLVPGDHGAARVTPEFSAAVIDFLR